jgi:hypothetical protein
MVTEKGYAASGIARIYSEYKHIPILPQSARERRMRGGRSNFVFLEWPRKERSESAVGMRKSCNDNAQSNFNAKMDHLVP